MQNFRSSADLDNLTDAATHEMPEVEQMAMRNSTETILRSALSQTEKDCYPDSVFINAAQIFDTIHVQKSPDKALVKYGKVCGPSVPHFRDERTQRWSYKLAFNALKFQDLLENILLDSSVYPLDSLSDDATSLLVVMLYDFQDRKFQPRVISDADESIAEVREMENYLYSYKTKLAAALARCRIKYDALTIDYILPESVRIQEQRAVTVPVYAWINTAKISVHDICYALKMEGFNKVHSVSDLEGYTFCVDEHCNDVLAFPPNLKDQLRNMELFTDYKLILQDKSQSLAVHSVRSLMNLDDDVIVTNMYSGLTVAHMSALTNQLTCNIFVCGITASKEAELQHLFTHMECKNVKLFQESFTNIQPTDPRFHKAKVILLQPQCSGSGVNDPVEFIVNEHGDAGLLQDFSQGSVSEGKLNILSSQQLQAMVHAMRFNKVQAIVYYTCSVYKEENEEVVCKALECSVEENKKKSYRLNPPVLPLCSQSEIISSTDKFFKVEPSEISNGCFLAVLTRERDPAEAVSVKDVLARAAAKGLLQGVDLSKPSKRDERKKKFRSTGQKPLPSTTVSQSKIADFLSKESQSLENTKVSTSKTMTEIPLNTVNQINSSNQLKKPHMYTASSSSTVQGVMKNKNSLSSMSKMYEKTASTGKLKPEERLIVLKPVEILLPPVMMPYHNPLGNKVRSPPYPYYYRWAGLKTTGHSFPPSLSIVGKSKETFPFNVVRHPRPWL